MAKLSYQKREVALRQLETAVRLFQERKDPFSVITLAGAAEEILGRYVRAAGKRSSLQLLNDAALAIQRIEGDETPVNVIDRANYARNNLKHLTCSENRFSVDAWEEAKDMLIRAIDNYSLLEDYSSPSIETFLQQSE
jgi:hypothetical protein